MASMLESIQSTYRAEEIRRLADRFIDALKPGSAENGTGDVFKSLGPYDLKHFLAALQEDEAAFQPFCDAVLGISDDAKTLPLAIRLVEHASASSTSGARAFAYAFIPLLLWRLLSEIFQKTLPPADLLDALQQTLDTLLRSGEDHPLLPTDGVFADPDPDPDPDPDVSRAPSAPSVADPGATPSAPGRGSQSRLMESPRRAGGSPLRPATDGTPPAAGIFADRSNPHGYTTADLFKRLQRRHVHAAVLEPWTRLFRLHQQQSSVYSDRLLILYCCIVERFVKMHTPMDDREGVLAASPGSEIQHPSVSPTPMPMPATSPVLSSPVRSPPYPPFFPPSMERVHRQSESSASVSAVESEGFSTRASAGDTNELDPVIRWRQVLRAQAFVRLPVSDQLLESMLAALDTALSRPACKPFARPAILAVMQRGMYEGFISSVMLAEILMKKTDPV